MKFPFIEIIIQSMSLEPAQLKLESRLMFKHFFHQCQEHEVYDQKIHFLKP